MSYFSHKWKSFLNESKKEIKEDAAGFKRDIKTATIKLPQLRLSDNWGKPGSDSRTLIEKVFKGIAKGATDPFEKIKAVNNFVENCDESCREKKTMTEIITSMMFLDALHALAYDFNQSVGGYLFESFMAALFGGGAKAIPTGEGTIADIYDDKGNPISLKFYEGGKILDTKTGKQKDVGSKEVGGSLYDLARSIKPGKPMTYLLTRKMKKGSPDINQIVFFKFTIGTKRGMRLKVKGKPELMTKDVKADFQIGPNFGVYEDGKKFKVSISDIMGKAKPIATLNFGGPTFLKETAVQYADMLQGDVTNSFNALDSLTKNLTLYFADEQGGSSAIQQAEKDSVVLKDSVAGIKRRK